jgi:transcriptional regulator
MYVPDYSRQSDPELIAELLGSHPFAVLVTGGGTEPQASHLPLLHDAVSGSLRGHMARANPQWRRLEAGASALAVFHGPHAYVSPSAYAGALNVPTWNYAAIHVYGRAEVLHEPEAIERILQESVRRFERGREQPWAYDLPHDFRDRLLRAIVGFELRIERIEAKFKLSQNRERADYEGVVAELARLKDPSSAELLGYMRWTAPPGF